MDLRAGSERAPGGGNGNPLQDSCLGNPMVRGAWQAIVHGVKNCQIRLSDWAHTHTHSNTVRILTVMQKWGPQRSFIWPFYKLPPLPSVPYPLVNHVTIILFPIYITDLSRRVCKWNHMMCNLLILAFLSQHNPLEIHSGYFKALTLSKVQFLIGKHRTTLHLHRSSVT